MGRWARLGPLSFGAWGIPVEMAPRFTPPRSTNGANAHPAPNVTSGSPPYAIRRAVAVSSGVESPPAGPPVGIIGCTWSVDEELFFIEQLKRVGKGNFGKNEEKYGHFAELQNAQFNTAQPLKYSKKTWKQMEGKDSALKKKFVKMLKLLQADKNARKTVGFPAISLP